MPIPLEGFRPGDVLLYGGTGLFNRLIQFKTWSRYSHVEIYDGGGYALASRNGRGVGRYPVRLHDLLAILRLRVPCDLEALRTWHDSVDGQPYDWFGLLNFASAKRQGHENWKMFCSEYVARALRAGIGAAASGDYPQALGGDRRVLATLALDPFGGYDADGIAPGEVRKSALLRVEAEL